jgi:hypothetical protein
MLPRQNVTPGGLNAITVSQPPAAAMTSGVASANPASLTNSCTLLTRAALVIPPAAKYAVITVAPIRQPTPCETPPAMLSTAATPSSCAHSTSRLPSQMMSAARPRTVCPK